MGLSDGERRTNIIYSCKNIMRIVKNIEEKKEYDEKYYYLRMNSNYLKLLHELPYAVFGKVSNGLHWFMGSETSRIPDEPKSPWGIAIQNRLCTEYEKMNSFYLNLGDMPYARHEIGELLDGEFRDIFMIFAYTENIVYALRRYKDQFLKDYEYLDRLISSIWMESFIYFDIHEEFPKAYLLSEVIEKYIFKEYRSRDKYGIYDKEGLDDVEKIYVENVQHKLKGFLESVSLKEMISIHLKFVSLSAEKLDVGRMRFLSRYFNINNLENALKGSKFSGKQKKGFIKLQKRYEEELKEKEEKRYNKSEEEKIEDELGCQYNHWVQRKDINKLDLIHKF